MTTGIIVALEGQLFVSWQCHFGEVLDYGEHLHGFSQDIHVLVSHS